MEETITINIPDLDFEFKVLGNESDTLYNLC